MAATAQFKTHGYPVLEPVLSKAASDLRTEARFVCRGNVRLALMGGTAGLKGELLDVSAHGFRVSFDHPGLEVGTDVRFSHQFFHGRARVMWTLQTDERFEAGCMVLRD